MAEAARGNGVDSVATGHPCDTTTTTDQCSSDVLFNGSGAVRVGDLNSTHTYLVGETCVPHTVALSSGSQTVFVNGKAVARKGDSYGSEVITSGSSNINIG